MATTLRFLSPQGTATELSQGSPWAPPAETGLHPDAFRLTWHLNGPVVTRGCRPCRIGGVALDGRPRLLLPGERLEVDGASLTHLPRSSPSHPPLGELVPRLVVLSGLELGRAIPLLPGARTVGRDVACDLRFEDATISRLHATVRLQEGAVVWEDARPLRPTRVDGRPIAGATTLRNGQAIELGETVLGLLLPTPGTRISALPPCEPAVDPRVEPIPAPVEVREEERPVPMVRPAPAPAAPKPLAPEWLAFGASLAMLTLGLGLALR